jgi:uncharacterized small protein (DUF1192 family)
VSLFQEEISNLKDELKIKEVKVTDDKRIKELEDEIDYLYNEIGRHIGRINQLSAELETKDAIRYSKRRNSLLS